MISFRIALRFLRAGRGQTTLIIAGIAVAISIQVFVALLIDSLQRTLLDSTIGNSPHITVTPSSDSMTITRWQSTVDQIGRINKLKSILVSASSNGFVRKGSNTIPVLIRGFDFEVADRIYGFDKAIYEGRPYESRGEVVVGYALRDELELELGEKLTVRTPSGSESSFKISGFYNLGIASIDRSWAITELETAQAIFGFGNRITEIELTVNDPFNADTIGHEIERQLSNKDIQIDNWKAGSQELLSGLEGQRISSAIIQIVILISVFVAIASVLAITVLQKSRQIGILKAIGIKDRTASMIFVYQGLAIGIVGSGIGVALGTVLLFSFDFFTSGAGTASVVDIYLDWTLIIRSYLIGVLASTVAGVVPARRSLKLDPVDVIREG